MQASYTRRARALPGMTLRKSAMLHHLGPGLKCVAGTAPEKLSARPDFLTKRLRTQKTSVRFYSAYIHGHNARGVISCSFIDHLIARNCLKRTSHYILIEAGVIR
jgi:hypothetical protein